MKNFIFSVVINATVIMISGANVVVKKRRNLVMTNIEGMTRAKCIRSIVTSVDYGFPFLTLFRTYRVVNIYEEEENKEK